MIGVYKFTSPSGKIYVGSSKDINNRIKYYKCLDCKGQRKLYNSLVKYGYEAHIFEILEECNFELLYERERHYGEIFNVLNQETGLNLSLPKTNKYKTAISDETRLKMSEAHKGDKNYFYRQKHTLESRIKISEKAKGRKPSEETKRKLSINSTKPLSKLVIDLETGIFYDSIKDAAFAKGIIHSTLKNRVNGNSPTRTMIVYA